MHPAVSPTADMVLESFPHFRLVIADLLNRPSLHSKDLLRFPCTQVESLGDYYAAAKICGAPVPPPAVLGRAVTWQGICCVIAGLFGTANGTTAYNENVGGWSAARPCVASFVLRCQHCAGPSEWCCVQARLPGVHMQLRGM